MAPPIIKFRVGLSKTDKLSLNPEDSGSIDLEPEEGESSDFLIRIRDFSLEDGIVNNTQRLTLAYKTEHQTQRHLITAGGEMENQKGELGTDTTEEVATPEDAPPFFRRLHGVGIVLSYENQSGGLPSGSHYYQNNMLLTGGVRLEKNGSFGFYAMPRAAMSLNLGSTTTLKASAGMGLKEPSLEQSYGGNFRVQGNPDLKPESSLTFDAWHRPIFLG